MAGWTGVSAGLADWQTYVRIYVRTSSILYITIHGACRSVLRVTTTVLGQRSGGRLDSMRSKEWNRLRVLRVLRAACAGVLVSRGGCGGWVCTRVHAAGCMAK